VLFRIELSQQSEIRIRQHLSPMSKAGIVRQEAPRKGGACKERPKIAHFNSPAKDVPNQKQESKHAFDS
jgi:hypothetical protein